MCHYISDMHTPSKRYALIGAAGFVAPRHMQAIHDTGGTLVAALDPHDSVGILDSYGYDIAFFTEFERFDRHVEKLRRADQGLDYVSIVSPNYLHDAHIRFALRVGADAICEKPLVLNPWNVDALEQMERESGQRIYNVLQLRLHPSIIALRERVQAAEKSGKRQAIRLTYITSRGTWYTHSWKGDMAKSGGVATNIGIHFFDMLLWIFGPARQSRVTVRDTKKMGGTLELEHADVEWFLSVDASDLPHEAVQAGMPTWRRLELDGDAFEFSGGFKDLHTRVYEDILSGGGFGLADARPSIELVHGMR